MFSRIIIFTLILTAPLSAFAFDWAQFNLNPADASDESKSFDELAQETIEKLTDEKGRTLTLRYRGEVTEETARSVSILFEKLYSFKSIKASTLNFRVSGNIIDVILIPESFEGISEPTSDYMPAGMLFQQSDSLEYNFRIMKDGIFVRVNGVFIDENELTGKLKDAYNHPRDYMRKRDPEYFLRKLDELESSYARLKHENEKLRYAVMTLHNEGFLWGVYPIDKKAIDEVISLKKSDPSLNKEQLAKALKEKGYEIGEDEIFLILSVYFNEFK